VEARYTELCMSWQQTHISACSWPFSCIIDVSMGNVKVVVHDEGADNGWHPFSLNSVEGQRDGRMWPQMTKIMNDTAILHGIIVHMMMRGQHVIWYNRMCG
jgi:hypothetical protein